MMDLIGSLLGGGAPAPQQQQQPQAGGGMMDLIGSLLGGGAPAPQQQQQAQQPAAGGDLLSIVGSLLGGGAAPQQQQQHQPSSQPPTKPGQGLSSNPNPNNKPDKGSIADAVDKMGGALNPKQKLGKQGKTSDPDRKKKSNKGSNKG